MDHDFVLSLVLSLTPSPLLLPLFPLTQSLDHTAACAPYKDVFRNLQRSLEPVTKAVRSGWLAYLPKLTFPVRSGVHSNTAFGLT